MKWHDFLTFDRSVDGFLRLLFVALLGGYLVMNSTVFEVDYGEKLIDMYIRPWWRLLVVLLVIASGLWCPRVGIVLALVAFFYLSDMETLIQPLAVTEK